MSLHNKLCESIDKSVDENQCLGAGTIADQILSDFLQDEINKLESMADNAHLALEAILASGVCDRDVVEMAELGLNNKPQLKTTRLS